MFSPTGSASGGQASPPIGGRPGPAAAVFPAAPGIARAIEGRPGALPLLAVAVALAAAAGALNAAAAMYESRQETRRIGIERRAADTLAAALARCLDDAHAKAQNLSEVQDIQETARVRASACQLLADVVPPVTALLGQAETARPAL
jgi:hypothetical protein